MIHLKKSNNLEYQQIKPINYLIEIGKVNSKQIIIQPFINSCCIVQNTCQKGSKINKNVPKSPLLETIQQYLTFKKVFVSNTKQ